jgi:hypothetical protein
MLSFYLFVHKTSQTRRCACASFSMIRNGGHDVRLVLEIPSTPEYVCVEDALFSAAIVVYKKRREKRTCACVFVFQKYYVEDRRMCIC